MKKIKDKIGLVQIEPNIVCTSILILITVLLNSNRTYKQMKDM